MVATKVSIDPIQNPEAKFGSTAVEDEKPPFLPPLSSLIKNTSSSSSSSSSPSRNSQTAPTIIGNVDFLLDFVIAGFPKTGTTTLARNFFDNHPQINIPPKEVHLLSQIHPAPVELVEMLYKKRLNGKKEQHPDNIQRIIRDKDKPKKKGMNSTNAASFLDSHFDKENNTQKKIFYAYKAPRDIATFHVHELYAKYFPSTKLIVGLRHPIELFHSFYNFKMRKNDSAPIPPAELLTGRCVSDHDTEEEMSRYMLTQMNGTNDRGVCADLTRYHVPLSWLGKTNHTLDPGQQALLKDPRVGKAPTTVPLSSNPNPVFLYDVSQLNDPNITRQALFLKDLQLFLGLKTPFPLPRKPKPIHHDYKTKFDICLEKYRNLRTVLMQNGKESYLWLTRYFLRHPDVHVSSQEYFVELLRKYQHDPCPSSSSSSSTIDVVSLVVPDDKNEQEALPI